MKGASMDSVNNFLAWLLGDNPKIQVDEISEPEAAQWRLSGQTVDLLAIEPGGMVTAFVGEVEP